jgi:hypothetical protein
MTDAISTGAVLLVMAGVILGLPGAVGFFVRPKGSWIIVPAAATVLALVTVILVFMIAAVSCSPDCSDADFGYGVGLIALGPITFIVVLPGLVFGKLIGRHFPRRPPR